MTAYVVLVNVHVHDRCHVKVMMVVMSVLCTHPEIKFFFLDGIFDCCELFEWVQAVYSDFVLSRCALANAYRHLSTMSDVPTELCSLCVCVSLYVLYQSDGLPYPQSTG